MQRHDHQPKILQTRSMETPIKRGTIQALFSHRHGNASLTAGNVSCQSANLNPLGPEYTTTMTALISHFSRSQLCLLLPRQAHVGKSIAIGRVCVCVWPPPPPPPPALPIFNYAPCAELKGDRSFQLRLSSCNVWTISLLRTTVTQFWWESILCAILQSLLRSFTMRPLVGHK